MYRLKKCKFVATAPMAASEEQHILVTDFVSYAFCIISPEAPPEPVHRSIAQDRMYYDTVCLGYSGLWIPCNSVHSH